MELSIRYGTTEVASAATEDAALRQAPSHPPLDAAGMVATMARAPLYAADEFTLDVAAYTGPPGYALLVW